MNQKIVKFRIPIAVLVTLLLCTAFFIVFRNNTMYSEYVQIGNNASVEKLSSQTQVFSQTFQSPYELLEGVKVKIGTYQRINNSEWLFVLLDDATGKEIHRWEQVGKSFVDNDFHYFRLPRKYETDEGQIFTLNISSPNVDEVNSLAFYTSDEIANSEFAKGGLFVNNTELEKTLAVRIVGGDRSDKYWLSVSVILGAIMFFLLNRILSVQSKAKQSKAKQSKAKQSKAST